MPPSSISSLPKLPARAAYLTSTYFSPERRNVLSRKVLQDLYDNLSQFNTSPVKRKTMLLPPFKTDVLARLENASRCPQALRPEHRHGEEEVEDLWLVSSKSWLAHRAGLPNVLVLRTTGSVFSSGHDLKEVSTLSHENVQQTFELCANVMRLIRQCPVPVVSVVQGLATAAGAQLALMADICIADGRNAVFQLPGQSIGLPCTSPATIVSRRLGSTFTYRMLSLAEGVRAADLPPGSVDVIMPGAYEDEGENIEGSAFEKRIHEVVTKLAAGPAQPQALGKWAYWTQHAIDDSKYGGDGSLGAAKWAGRVMALHAQSDDAKEGMRAFLEKRAPQWKT